nr:MAG TPA: hypothetical protein [Bacteriophage sp.]
MHNLCQFLIGNVRQCVCANAYGFSIIIIRFPKMCQFLIGNVRLSLIIS